MSFVVRPSRPKDVPAITAIYATHVLEGSASFETAAPDAAEMERRRQLIFEAGLPHLVAEFDDQVIGFGYAGPYRPRRAYRFTVEDSVYLAPVATGRGIGAKLLGAVITACEAGPWRHMIAVIGDTGNAASIAVHRRCGFTITGVLHSVGWKHGRWVDSVLMERPLGPGDTTPPPDDA